MCKKVVKRIDRHLINVHGDFLTKEDQKILKDFHRFQESSSKARFCFTCARRVASIPNHKSRCNGKPQKIQNQHCLSSLPQSLKNKIKESRIARKEDVDRVEEYIQFQKEAQEVSGSRSNEERWDRPWFKNTLAIFYGETAHFTQPQRLLQVARAIQQRQQLAPQTVVTYLCALKKFTDYIVIRENVDGTRINAALDEVKGIFQSSAVIDSRKRATERFQKVPRHEIVVTRHEQVLKILQQNLDAAEDERLSLKEEKTLNYFLLQSRLNCRSQPVLDLTWEKLEEIKSKGSILTSRHKTGQYYDVALRVEQDQIPLLEKLKETYTREQTVIPPFIFATRTGKKDRSMSKQIQEIFQQRFGDKPEKVKFNSNSIRKYREERMQQLRKDEQIAPVVLSEHLQQTGHTQQTAQKHYMAPNLENRNKLLDLLVNDLRTVEEDCEDEEATPATVAQIEELTIGDATAVEIRQDREKEIERQNRGNIHFHFIITNLDRS